MLTLDRLFLANTIRGSNMYIEFTDPNGVKIHRRDIMAEGRALGMTRGQRMNLAAGFDHLCFAKQAAPHFAGQTLNSLIMANNCFEAAGIVIAALPLAENVNEIWMQIKDGLGIEAVDWLAMTETDLHDDDL